MTCTGTYNASTTAISLDCSESVSPSTLGTKENPGYMITRDSGALIFPLLVVITLLSLLLWGVLFSKRTP